MAPWLRMFILIPSPAIAPIPALTDWLLLCELRCFGTSCSQRVWTQVLWSPFKREAAGTIVVCEHIEKDSNVADPIQLNSPSSRLQLEWLSCI